MAILPKYSYIFSVIPIKIPTDFFAEMDKLFLTFIFKLKGPQIAKTIRKRIKLVN